MSLAKYWGAPAMRARHGVIGQTAPSGGMLNGPAPMYPMAYQPQPMAYPPQAYGCCPYPSDAWAATFGGISGSGNCVKQRVYPLNFRQSVAAGDTVTLTVRPQKAFSVTKIVVPSSIADLFVINQISVGTVPQIVGNDGAGVLAQVFSEGAQDVGVFFDVAVPGIDLSVQVENLDTVNAQTFFMTLLGPVLEASQ
jgi:hypothetical protein